MKANKASTILSIGYSDYTDVILPEFTTELAEHISKNNHTIEIEKDKQPLYDSNCSLKPVKLEKLKVYIKTILVNAFIKPFKLLARH